VSIRYRFIRNVYLLVCAIATAILRYLFKLFVVSPDYSSSRECGARHSQELQERMEWLMLWICIQYSYWWYLSRIYKNIQLSAPFRCKLYVFAGWNEDCRLIEGIILNVVVVDKILRHLLIL